MTKAMTLNPTLRGGISLALLTAAVLATSAVSHAQSDAKRHSRPFDQAYFASSAQMEILEASETPNGSSGEPVELLQSTINVRPQGSKDLLIGVDAECAALLNEVQPPEGEEETSSSGNGASVAVWVELDGEPVPVSDNGAQSDDGSVVYCTADGSADFATTDPDALLSRFDAMREARGFNWAAADVGKGEHEVVVKAILALNTEGTPEEPAEGEEAPADAMALVGKRTLTVELANASFEAPEEAETE